MDSQNLKKPTPEQEKFIEEYFQRGLKVGLCTDPINEENARKYTKKLNKHAERPVGCSVILNGPVECWMAACLLSVWDISMEIEDCLEKVKACLAGKKPDSFIAPFVPEFLKVSLDQIKQHALFESKHAEFFSQHRELSLKVWGTMVDQCALELSEGTIEDFVWPYLDGQFFAFYSTWGDYYAEVIGEKPEDYSLIKDQTEFGLVFPLINGIVVYSQRPTRLKINENEVLHAEDGPAISYKDGTDVWALDGFRVDEKVVLAPETQELKEIEAEGNADIKTLRINRFAGKDQPPEQGWLKYLKACNAQPLDERHNDIDGTHEALMVLPNGGKILVATCPSGKLAVMPVLDKIKTCEAAQKFLSPVKGRDIGRT